MAYNTNNPVGSTDPRDLFDNAGNMDKFENGPNPFYPDRFGVQKLSRSGMIENYNNMIDGQESAFNSAQSARDAEFAAFLANSGFVSLGNYASGLEFTRYNQYMARGGFFYRPAPSSLPFTTTGTWDGADENLFNLFSQDDVLRQDLANSTNPAKGAALVGYDEATDYPDNTVGHKLNALPAERASVRPQDFDPLAGNNDGRDDTAAVQAAINDGRPVDLGEGFNYRCTRLIGRSKLVMLGRSTLDFSGNASYANTIADPLFKIWGSAGPVVAVTAPIAQYATLIDVADTTGIAPDNLIEIATPGTTGDFEDTSVRVHNGEICQVLEVVSSTQLRLAEPVLDRFGYAPINNAQIRKLNTVDDVVIGAGITIKGRGRPQPSGAGDNGIIIMYGRRVKVQCSFHRVDFACVRFEGCYDYEASEGTYIMDIQGANGNINYGVVPSGSSKHGRVFRTKHANMRHAVVTSHLSSALGLNVWGVVRDLKVYDNTCVNTWHAAIATHSDCDTIEIYRNNIFGCTFGVNPRERNVSIHDNLIVNCGQAITITARPRDLSIVRNKAVGCTGNFVIANGLAGSRDLTGVTIEDNEVIRCGGGIVFTLFTPASGHRRFSIKNNKFREIAGKGGAQALIRITGGGLVDSTISYNEAQDCVGVSGIALDGGGTRLQLLGNNMQDVDGNSFTTVPVGGYTNCFGKANVVKTGGWPGNTNMTNGATIVADNTFF